MLHCIECKMGHYEVTRHEERLNDLADSQPIVLKFKVGIHLNRQDSLRNLNRHLGMCKTKQFHFTTSSRSKRLSARRAKNPVR